jgi:peptide-methionine (S)-S-oxide reductase
MRTVALFSVAFVLTLVACTRPGPNRTSGDNAIAEPIAATNGAPHVGTDPGHVGYGTPLTASPGHELAAFAAGCFWGVEDAFRHVQGVTATAVGYSGGRTDDPTYESVSAHTTGHAETVLVEYDPARVSYDHLLRVFWAIHDPTQGDRQGPDVGSNYRSVVFAFSDAQTKVARTSLEAERPKHKSAISTTIAPIGRFFAAEGYHQQYSERTGDHSCPIRVPADTL